MFNITHRNDTKYKALYIFYFGTGNLADVNHSSRVYATITTKYSPVAVCGRALLKKKPYQEPVYPIEIYSQEYFDINSSQNHALSL